jgi:hypothetical protein
MSRADRILVSVLAAAVAAPGTFAETPDPGSAESLRAEIQVFFERQAELSPTVLAGLAADPGLEGAIADGLAQMAPEELESLSAGFEGVPAWELAPEALSAALPPAVRQAFVQRGEEAEQAARELEAFRDELSMLPIGEATLALESSEQRPEPGVVAVGIEGEIVLRPPVGAELPVDSQREPPPRGVGVAHHRVPHCGQVRENCRRLRNILEKPLDRQERFGLVSAMQLTQVEEPLRVVIVRPRPRPYDLLEVGVPTQLHVQPRQAQPCIVRVNVHR